MAHRANRELADFMTDELAALGAVLYVDLEREVRALYATGKASQQAIAGAVQRATERMLDAEARAIAASRALDWPAP